IDCNKNRNKGDEEFVDHASKSCFKIPLLARDEQRWNADSSKFLLRCLRIYVNLSPIQVFSLSMSNILKILFLYPLLFFASSGSSFSAAELKTVGDFRGAAAKAKAVLTIPDWEQTPEAVEASMKNAIAKANAALDQIGSQDLGKVTFKSTVVALDDATYQAGLAANKATLIKETNTNPAMRAAAENAVKTFQDWAVGIDSREDVYKAIKAFVD